MTKLLTYVLLLMVASSTIATAQSPLEARVVNVLAGDLLIVSIDHEAEVVQLYGVDCPERGEAGWLKARNYTEQMVLFKQIGGNFGDVPHIYSFRNKMIVVFGFLYHKNHR